MLANDALRGAYSDYMDELMKKDINYGMNIVFSAAATAIEPYDPLAWGGLMSALTKQEKLSNYISALGFFQNIAKNDYESILFLDVPSKAFDSYSHTDVTGWYTRSFNQAFIEYGQITNITGFVIFQPNIASYQNPLQLSNLANGWSEMTYVQVQTVTPLSLYTPPIINFPLYQQPIYNPPIYNPPIYIPPYIPPIIFP